LFGGYHVDIKEEVQNVFSLALHMHNTSETPECLRFSNIEKSNEKFIASNYILFPREVQDSEPKSSERTKISVCPIIIKILEQESTEKYIIHSEYGKVHITITTIMGKYTERFQKVEVQICSCEV
jgi:hypothetical protein